MKKSILSKAAYFVSGCALSLLVVFLSHRRPPQKTASEPDVVFARVDGKDIYGKEILPKIQGQLNQIKYSEYELERRSTDEYINQQLVEKEAKRLGVSKEKLLESYSGPNHSPNPNKSFVQNHPFSPKNVTSADIRKFMVMQRIDPKTLSPQARGALPEIMKSFQVNEAHMEMIQNLRAKANVQILIPPPVTGDRVHLQ